MAKKPTVALELWLASVDRGADQYLVATDHSAHGGSHCGLYHHEGRAADLAAGPLDVGENLGG